MEKEFKEQLKNYRQEIDKIDQGLVNLLNERALIVAKIKKLKEKNNWPLYDAKREWEMINNIVSNNRGPIMDEGITEIFESILRNLRLLEKEGEHPHS